jgi:hypothetical protein
MGDYRTIAAVTAVIRDILAESQQSIDGSPVNTKTSPPATLKGLAEDVLNLFLYQVTPNNAYCSFNLPTKNQNGKLIAKPLLALNLHYLLTASSSNELKAQLMLSNAMIALQENAIIPKNKIIKTLTNHREESGEEFLANSNLANETETIKISLQTMSIEELTKLWSSFFQTDYRLSVTYQVSIGLLESQLEPVPSIPVSKRQLHIIAIRQPIIEKIEPQIMPYDSARKLFIKGHNLNSDKVLVRLNEKEIEIVDKKDLSEHQLSLSIPADTPAGVKQVQILQKILFEPNNKTAHQRYVSNVIAFVIAPCLKKITPPTLNPGATLTLKFEPGVTINQKINVLIGDYVITNSLPATTPSNYPLTSITVKIPLHIPAGTYPVRLRIDNAESPFSNDSNHIITITPNSQKTN